MLFENMMKMRRIYILVKSKYYLPTLLFVRQLRPDCAANQEGHGQRHGAAP